MNSDYSVSDFRDPDKFRTGYDTCHKCGLRRYLDARAQCDDYSEIHIGINDTVSAGLKNGGHSSTYEKLGYHAYSSEFLRAILDSGCRVIVHRVDSDGKLVKHVLVEGDQGGQLGKATRESKRNGRRSDRRGATLKGRS